jgi:hypothetical protein
MSLMCLIRLCSVCFIVPAVVLIIRGEGAERGGDVENCLLGIADFGIAYFGIAYFGTKESDCLLCGRLAYFE